MNQITNIDERRQLSPSQQFRQELDKMSDQFSAALPSHIKPEKFQRVVTTAVLSDPDILRADRKSLMESAIRAAQDGLLPDKREGAFVVFNTKIKVDGKDTWVKAVQWMPMVGGIIKRIHQSGEIKMLTARVVYGGDHFRTWIDDTGEHVEYEPAEDQDTNVVRRVFAMATTVDGAVYVEPLSSRDIEKIRNVSKQKDRGPWADWWEEMAKKSAIRRLAKRLPLSVDLHDLIQRDNGMFDLAQETEPKTSLSDRLKAAKNVTPEPKGEREGFSGTFIADQTDEPHDALTGEIIDNTNTDEAAPSSSLVADEAAPSVSSAEPETSAPKVSGSNIPEEFRQHFIDFARKALTTAADKELTEAQRNEAIEDSVIQYRDVIPEELWGKLSGIKLPIMYVVTGQRTKEKAASFIARDVLDCDPAVIGG